eukprot:6102579-Prymnesium_polylepis.1
MSRGGETQGLGRRLLVVFASDAGATTVKRRSGSWEACASSGFTCGLLSPVAAASRMSFADAAGEP